MFYDLAEPEMMKVINQARAQRSREMARLFRKFFRRQSPQPKSVAVTG